MKYCMVTTMVSKPGMHGPLCQAFAKQAEWVKKNLPKITQKIFENISGSGNQLVLIMESDSMEDLVNAKTAGVEVVVKALQSMDNFKVMSDVFVDNSIDRQFLRSIELDE